jgi:hypothetical protein
MISSASPPSGISDLKTSCVFVQAYYGTFSGCQAVFIDACWAGAWSNVDEVTVAGCRFVLPRITGGGTSRQILYIHRDGAFKPIQDAYAAGWLTGGDVGAIWENFTRLGVPRTFTYKSAGTVLSTQTVQRGQPVTVPPDPEREGYIFNGWNWAEESRKANTQTYSAMWRPAPAVTLEMGQTFTVDSLKGGPTSMWAYAVSPSDGIDAEEGFHGGDCCRAIIGGIADQVFTFTAQAPGVYTVTLQHREIMFIWNPELLEQYPDHPPIGEIIFTITVPEPEPAPDPVLCPELEERMRDDYLKHLEAEYGVRMTHEFTCVVVLEYYGTYSGCQVVFIDSCWGGGLPRTGELTVAGKRFVFPDFGFFTRPLGVYRDGLFLRIDRAYDAGWITGEDVAEIWSMYDKIGLTRTVTYMDSDTVLHTGPERHGIMIAQPPTPKREGHVFTGWRSTTHSSIRWADVTFRAVWRPVSVTLPVGQTLTVEALSHNNVSGWMYTVSGPDGLEVTEGWRNRRCCKSLFGPSGDGEFSFTALIPGEYTVTLMLVDRMFIIISPELLEELFPGYVIEPFEEFTFTITVPEPIYEDVEVPYFESGLGRISPDNPQYPMAVIARSEQELRAIMSANNIGSLNHYYFDRDYFAAGAVVVVLGDNSSGSWLGRIMSFVRNGSTLKIYTTNSTGGYRESGIIAPNDYFYKTIDVKKADIDGVTGALVIERPNPPRSHIKDDARIHPEIALRLRSDYLGYLASNWVITLAPSLENVWVERYFGNYSGYKAPVNDFEAVFMGDLYTGGYTVIRNIEVAGYPFVFPDTRPLLIHKEGSGFLPLEDAYAAGWLTERDVGEIYNRLYPGKSYIPSQTLDAGQTYTTLRLSQGPVTAWVYSVSPSDGIEVTEDYSMYSSAFSFTAKAPGVYTVTMSHIDYMFILQPDLIDLWSELFPDIPFPEPYEEFTFTITVPEPLL